LNISFNAALNYFGVYGPKISCNPHESRASLDVDPSVIVTPWCKSVKCDITDKCYSTTTTTSGRTSTTTSNCNFCGNEIGVSMASFFVVGIVAFFISFFYFKRINYEKLIQ